MNSGSQRALSKPSPCLPESMHQFFRKRCIQKIMSGVHNKSFYIEAQAGQGKTALAIFRAEYHRSIGANGKRQRFFTSPGD